MEPLDNGLLKPGPQYGCKTNPSLPGGIISSLELANSSTARASTKKMVMTVSTGPAIPLTVLQMRPRRYIPTATVMPISISMEKSNGRNSQERHHLPAADGLGISLARTMTPIM